VGRCLQDKGLPVELMSLDVTDALQVKYVARQVAAGGPLDFVLYCAGHYRAQRATEYDLNDMLRHQDVNYNGLLRVLDAVLPVFLQQGHGHIAWSAAWRVGAVCQMAWLTDPPRLQ
jgi:NADP-dependent 3-hydroxy acid dehydrogenase YdfG